MEIIAGLVFMTILTLIVCLTYKEKEKVVEIIETEKPKKIKSKKKGKSMKKTSNVKITLPIDLMNETIFQGYVRWYHHYENILTNGDIHADDVVSVRERYLNIKSNMMVRIADRKDNYLNVVFGGDYSKFFVECKKLNDWLISDDIAQGKANVWDEIVKTSNEIELKAIIEGKESKFIDPKMNYEVRDELCRAMHSEIMGKLHDTSEKNLSKLMYELGVSKECYNNVIKNMDEGMPLEAALDKAIRDEEFAEIFKEKDILNNDPITEDVDVDSLLEEWGLQ